MDYKENILGNRLLNYIKPEPQEPRLAPPPLSSQAHMGLRRDVKPVIKPEPVNDAARVLIDRGLPVPAYIQSTPGAVSAPTQAQALNIGPSFAGRQFPQQGAFAPEPTPELQQIFYRKHQIAEEIQYAPEDALKEGLGMVNALKTSSKKLELGSKLRKDVWMREIDNLMKQGVPTTMIAVCGATGAGKSSILNAILDDNIVPTSGMQACTAVVTEIGYHNKKTIEGDVSFLSEAEWRAELAVLLDDLVDEDGNLKRSTDLRSDAGVAWQKVHAVYPSISQEQLVKMTVDQIIVRDRKIAKLLGETKHIVANDSKTFGEGIAEYIDSKDQKCDSKKKDKKADKASKEAKEKEKGKSLIEKMREQNRAKNAPLGIGSSAGASNGKDKKKDDDSDGSAFWPLIRQVQVKCNARALSTGAILVDLPGVADANAARNNIAKDYMKKCDCIWILAPITRAVDDKTARDLMGDAFKMQLMNGNYDDNAITFIATKCDDISCSEVIRALKLEDDPELEAIGAEIDRCQTEMEEWKEKKEEAEAAAKETDQTLKQLRSMLAESKEHLKALQDGESFTPKLTGSGKSKKSRKSSHDEDEDAEMSDASDDSSTGKRGRKRKSTGGRQRAAKRRKSDTFDDDDDFIVDDDEDLAFSDTDRSEDGGDGPADSAWDDASNTSDDENNNEDDDQQEEEEATEESVEAKITEYNDAIKQGRTELSEFRRQRKEAMDATAGLKKTERRAQREKNAFCSRKRSEFSRDVLKQDFRTGLKDLDDAAAEQRDPDSFDPTVNLRDYDAIDLPVFTCSARDYVRIKGQVKGDGDPTCFTKPGDTGVPALQEWCHHLTVSSRERAARTFLSHLKTFATQVKSYVQGIGDVTIADREALREKWESSTGDEDDDTGLSLYGGNMWDEFLDVDDGDDPFHINNLARLANSGLGGAYAMKNPPKVDRFGNLVGITPRLSKDFAQVVDNCVKELQERFREGLEEKCHLGAINAATAAVDTSDTFAASMHWATYRATLRRHGSWRSDLNVELSNPFTRQIASTWSKVFEADLFASFEHATNEAIAKVLKEVEESAALGLKERARGQAELAFDEAKVALRKTIDVVRDAINTQQKETSRCLAPHVQDQLTEGYGEAMLERGPGSVARQKNLFHGHVAEIKDQMFDGAADIILTRLAKSAEAVGKVLCEALQELAEKIEVGVAVLWEGPRDDSAQVKARTEVISSVADILRELELWQRAAQLRASKVEDETFA